MIITLPEILFQAPGNKILPLQVLFSRQTVPEKERAS